ncbi:thaumatin [Trametes elegans]|nr:thaumatin [Trametes elegans]
MKSFAAIAAAAFVSKAAARTFTVYNQCPFTIWPAMYTDLKVGTATTSHPTGWQQDAYQTVSFFVPDNWQAGQIWALNSCLDGGRNGGLVCYPVTGTGYLIAEFTLGINGTPDNYDAKLVGRFGGCPVADCPVDLGPNRPDHLKCLFDSSGFPVGCKSACSAGLGDPVNDPNCCTATHNTPATCPPTGIAFYDYFKGNCPNSYAYAYDESSGTALFTCDAGLAADYTVTFCP